MIEMRMQSNKQGNSKSKAEDLDCELIGKEVEVALYDSKVFRGVLANASRFWIRIDFDKKPIYLNKRFVVFIRPVH